MDAVPTAQFGAWIASARASGPPLDAGNYGRLAKQSSKVKPFTFRAVDARIFPAVVMQKLAPAPGPPRVEGGSSKSPGGES